MWGFGGRDLQTIGLQLVKRGKKYKVKPYTLEPNSTREAHDKWGTTYTQARYWLDDPEVEPDQLVHTNTD